MTMIKNKCFEVERSFKTINPSFSENIWSTETVPSLRVLCVAKIRTYGDQLKIDNLPSECQMLSHYLCMSQPTQDKVVTFEVDQGLLSSSKDKSLTSLDDSKANSDCS